MSGVPVALKSERVVLASVLYDQRTFALVRRLLSDDDWYLVQHERIWSACCELAEEGALDFTAVHERLSAASDSAGLTTLLELTGQHEPGSIEWHCEAIVAAAAKRAVLAAGHRLVQRAESPDCEPVGLAEEVIDELRLVQRAHTSETSSVSDFTDIVERVVDEADFVVPGLLARGNRIVITAPEGYGKSSLLRQIGACAAAGIHPFKTRGLCNPVRVLQIDAENPADVNTIEYRRVFDGLEALGRIPTRGMYAVDECGDQNLLDGRVAARFYGLIERVRPELLIIGPLYKLHEEDPNAEGPARKLSAVLNRMMQISGAALVTEAHTPHNDGPLGQLLRPYGASLWKRWPDFGYCLHPVAVPKRNSEPSAEELLSLQMRESYFTPWRGNRAMRSWPGRLSIGQHLPWGVTA